MPTDRLHRPPPPPGRSGSDASTGDGQCDGSPDTPLTHAVAVGAAALGGLFTSSQGRMNGELSARTGEPIEAAVWSLGSGLVVLTVLALALPGVRRGLGRIRAEVAATTRGGPVGGEAGGRDRGGVGGLRWWQCLGGLAGGLFVAAQTFAVPLIGVALFTVATVAGQTANGLVVDRLGLGPGGPKPVHPTRVLAAALAVLGVTVAVSDRLGDVGVAVVPTLLGLVVGALVAAQQGTNARVNVASGHVLSTTWLNFALGTLLLLLVAAAEGAAGLFTPASPGGTVPWWAWFGGLCGIGFVSIAAWAVRHLGVLVFGLSLLTGQLGWAVVLDLLSPATRDDVTGRVLLGVAVTFVAAVLAGWFARPRRTRSG